jgi:hypothetical protein
MTDFATAHRNAARAAAAPSFDIIDWMFKHGHKGYAAEIADLNSVKDEIRAEGGRYGHLCPYVAADLAKVDEEIEEVRRAAQDRFDDWATDGDY